MSRTIEQKVVEMRFDNSNFEKNVSQSMDSLNRLKSTIDKTSSANAFSGLSKALDNINFGSVTTAVQTVTEKFSLLEEIAIGAARNIGAALSNYVTKGLNDMVFKNISAGWDKYATKTEAIQTIMASIADQDFGNVDKMEYVEGLMEKLNWFTDETSYHLTDMISSIGKFTSAGVDLDKASDAMMGIATWAAVSGANANTASRVMYQLSQSLGLGSVRTQDWMSVETANMATKEFKELAIQVAKTQKTINGAGKAANGGKSAQVVTYQNFRETLKDGWLTSGVLTETLSQYSGFANALNRVYDAYGGNVPTSKLIKRFKEVQVEAKKSGKSLAQVFKDLDDVDVDFTIKDKTGKVIGDLTKNITELGIRAFTAAQEAKTFREAMDSVGDAASTVWMRVYETIFGNYEVAKELWTNLANDLYDLFVEPIWSVSEAIDEWRKLGGRGLLFGRESITNSEGEEEIIPTGAFDIMIRSFIDLSNVAREAFGEIFPLGGEQLVKLSQKALNLAKKFQKLVGNTEDLTKKFKNFFGFFKDIIDSVDIFNQSSEDSLDIIGLIKSRFEDAFTRVNNLMDRTKQLVGYLRDGIVAFFNAIKFNGTAIQNLGDTAQNLGEIGDDVAKALSPITLVFMKLGEFGRKAGTVISNVISYLTSIPKWITYIIKNTNLISNGASALKRILDAVRDGFNSAFDPAIFADIEEAFKYVWSGIKSFIDGFTANFDIYDKIKDIAKGIASAINLLGRAVQFLLTPIRALSEMSVFEEIGKFLSGTVLNAILSIPATIGRIITKLDEFIKTHPRVQEAVYDIATIFASIVRFVLTSANAISDFIQEAKPLQKVGGWIKDLFSSLKESELFSSLIRNLSAGFDAVVKFFREDFHLTNFKNKIDEIGTSIENLTKKSEGLNTFKQNVRELWENIKKLFSGEEDFEGFGADFMAGFGKGLINGVNSVVAKAKEIGQKVLDAIKDFFGIHSPSTVMEDIGEDLMAGLTNGIKDNIKGPVGAIKQLGSTIFARISGLFTGKSEAAEGDVDGAEKETSVLSASMGSIGQGIKTFFSKALGVLGIAIPTIAGVKLFNGIRSILAPFDALADGFKALKWRIKGQVIVDAIRETGSAVSAIVKALGLFLLEAGAFAVILAVADKISGGKLWTLFGQMAAFIAEILGGIGLLIRGLSGYQKISGTLENGVISGDFTQNKTAENIKAIGEIFVDLGEAMMMLAGAVAVLAFAHSQFGDSTVEAFKLLTIFGGVLLTIGFVVAKFTDDETKSFATLDKSGLAFEHSGWSEGLYAIGSFMKQVGISMALMAAAAAIVVKATGGDVNQMHEAFQGMMGIMTITMGSIILITAIAQKMPSTGMDKASEAIKSAGVSLVGISVALRVIAKTVIMLGRAKDSDLDKGVVTIAKIGLVLLGFAALAAIAPKDTNYKSLGFMAMEMAAAMVVLGLLVKKLGEMNPTEMAAGLRALITFGIFFAVISTLTLVATSINTDTKQFAGIGFMLLEISGAFLIMSAALKTLGSTESIGKAIGGLLASFVALGALFAAVSVMTIVNKGRIGELVAATAGLLLVAASISVVMKTMASVGTVFASNEGSLGKAALALLAVVVALTVLGFVAKATGPALLIFGAGIAALGVGMTLLALGFSIFVNTMILLVAEAALIGGALADGFGGFLDKFVALEPKLEAALMMVFTVLSKTITAKLTEISVLIFKIIKKILEALSKELDEILALLGPILDKLNVFITEKLALLVGLIQPIIDNIITHIVRLLTDILVPGVINAAQQIRDFVCLAIAQISQTVITTVDYIVTSILTTINNAINGETGILAIIKNALMGENGILTIVDEFLHTLLENVRGMATDIVDTVIFLISEVVRGVKESTDTVLGGIEELILTVAEHIVSMADTILTAIVNVIDGLATTIESHSGDFWSAVKHLVRAIWNSFWGLFSGDGENGIGTLAKNVMSGFGNGLLDHVGEALSAVGNVASSIWAKFKEKLGINSPSVIAALLGGFLDTGLAKGIAEKAGVPMGSVSNLGDGIINSLTSSLLGGDVSALGEGFGDNITNSLTDALGGMSDVLNTDDFTPTITPVLDLSEIQNGASKIPGMINSGSGYTVDTTAVVRSAYSPYEYYDGTEKVSTSDAQLDYFEQLRAKMDEMVNKFASAKVVLDTGAVVGGIVDPMDMALGQKMAQVGRGVYSTTR